MSVSYELSEITFLVDGIDELSTRLILNGAAALRAQDFIRLGEIAVECGSNEVAVLAVQIAEAIETAGDAASPDLMGVLSVGLVELRAVIDGTSTDLPSQSVKEESRVLETQKIGATSSGQMPVNNSLAGDEDLILEFITESREHLAAIEGQMLILERDNTDAETLNAVFRAFHTIKGLAGFLEFAAIQALAHEVETLLDLARTSQLVVTPYVVDVVLESTDVVRHELAGIESRLAGRPAPASGVTEMLLQRIRETARGEVSAESISLVMPDESQDISVTTPNGNDTSGFNTSVPPARSPLVKQVSEIAKVPDSSSVRIDTGKLDLLMDMVGEMVIAQTLIGHSPALAAVKDARLLSDLTQLARITTDVQKITTGMRMVPIGTQFQKTARLIRDLSRRAGKQIVLETSGEDTELDKTIAEELSDPLLHMVRNSIDHGIETPEERIALGKDPVAHIRIEAYHQSGQIVVAISDDGRGLNREKILAKAQQNGLIHSGSQLSDGEIFLLIFEPGFSTAEKVTDISGRGVGMDVVRQHVQKLRGRIEIQSRAGQGTTFYLKLPLTLAIIEGLVVVVGTQRYIVPIFSVREMFRPTAEMLSTVQETGEMAMVRDMLLPVVRLHRRFEMEWGISDLTAGTLIVAESQGKQFCLFVDDVVGKQEVVIKSLGQSFKAIAGVAGCAILGDGRVGLILDIDGIYKGRA
jgi:two-component system chemotaxis sensor kinase CheA